MTDFMTDGQPIEPPDSAVNARYAQTPPTLGRAFGALFGESSLVAPAARAAARGAYAGSSWLDRALAETGEANAGMAIEPQIQSPMLSAAEANKQFAPPGTTITDAPMPEAIARMVGQAKTEEVQRESILSRFAADPAHGALFRFGVGTAAFLADPLNAGSLFLPGVGEEAMATRFGGGVLARTGARVIAGGATGAIAQAPLSATRYGLGREEASDYDLRAAFTDMAYAAAGGAALHAGIGGTLDFLTRGAARGDAMLGLVRRLEASGDTAISPKGAIGRYQIMPDTARELGFDPSRLTDPAYNEQVARAVLGKLQKQYGDDPEAILVAYNAGPGRANRWLQAGRDDSVLPQETQKYLARSRAQGDANVVQAADAQTKNGAMRTAISQITDGRQVDVLPVFDEAASRRASTAAALREQDGALAQQIEALPEGDAVSADRLTRVQAVERDLQNPDLEADQRRALMNRRDELLADTTPEKLQEAAAPIAQRRAMEAQRARIAEQIAMLERQGANERLSSVTAAASDPAGLAEAQRRLYAGGFAPGVAQSEFDALRERIYGKPEKAEGEGAAPQPGAEKEEPEPAAPGGKAAKGEPAPGGKAAKAGAAPAAKTGAAETPADREAATLEKQFGEGGEQAKDLRPEDRAELERSAEAVKAADLREQAYAQAAQCLTEAGL